MIIYLTTAPNFKGTYQNGTLSLGTTNESPKPETLMPMNPQGKLQAASYGAQHPSAHFPFADLHRPGKSLGALP